MMSEAEVHKAIVGHLKFRRAPDVLAMHLNNTPRNKFHGRKLKDMGLLKGAPDMLYAIEDGQVVWHEIKTEKGKLEPDQKEVHRLLKDLGHIVLVTYGLDDALKQLREMGIITGG